MFGTYKLPLEWVSNYKNYLQTPFGVSIFETKKNMLHTHNVTWYAIEVFLMQFEISFEKS